MEIVCDHDDVVASMLPGIELRILCETVGSCLLKFSLKFSLNGEAFERKTFGRLHRRWGCLLTLRL